MPKVKEIRKIENPVKEIKKEKVESLDDEFDEDVENEDFVNGFNGVRRFNKTSTLNASETPQDSAPRARRVSEEDEKEINFRPSYTGGGNPYKDNKYTPAGSAESGAVGQTRVLGEDRVLDRRNDLQQQNQGTNEQKGGEMGRGQEYVGEGEQQKRERRKNF